MYSGHEFSKKKTADKGELGALNIRFRKVNSRKRRYVNKLLLKADGVVVQGKDG